MRKLARFEMVETLALGIALPIVIMTWTLILIIENKGVFPGRGELVYFYDTQGYIVSSLWFGISIGLVTHFVLRRTILKNEMQRLKLLYYFSVLLISVGLFSSIWFAFVS